MYKLRTQPETVRFRWANLLHVPLHLLGTYSRAFARAGRSAWNSLPVPVRNLNATQAGVRRLLKTVTVRTVLVHSAHRQVHCWCAIQIYAMTLTATTTISIRSHPHSAIYRVSSLTALTFFIKFGSDEAWLWKRYSGRHSVISTGPPAGSVSSGSTCLVWKLDLSIDHITALPRRLHWLRVP